MTVKLQLALDTPDMSLARQRALELQPYWDILEIGTVLLQQEGLKAVEIFRSKFPDATLLADTKIVDSGSLLSSLAFEAGADLVTVISAASNETIKSAVKEARKRKGKVFLDHISSNWNDPALFDKAALGVDVVGLHLPKDQADKKVDVQINQTYLNKLGKPVSLAGGINPQKIEAWQGLDIYSFIVGSYLMKTDNSVRNAEEIRRVIKNF